jgi:hypothetical protein
LILPIVTILLPENPGYVPRTSEPGGQPLPRHAGLEIETEQQSSNSELLADQEFDVDHLLARADGVPNTACLRAATPDGIALFVGFNSWPDGPRGGIDFCFWLRRQ